jgi:hypothetical protein
VLFLAMSVDVHQEDVLAEDVQEWQREVEIDSAP